jgi:hypothetical protein
MNNIGQQLLDVPIAELISNMACSIAESQAKLDMGSIEILKQMADKDKNPVSLPFFGGNSVTTSMLGAGFQPTFYQFSETTIEVKMAISVSKASKEEKNPTTPPIRSSIFNRQAIAVKATSVNAAYTNTYNFNQEGSSLIRTTIVPIPPNPVILSLIERSAQIAMDDLNLQIGNTD